MKYYELGRYPDLVHQLVEDSPKTLEQVKPMLSNYPKEVADAVTDMYPMHLADLKSMDKTYQSSQKALHKITEDLPSDVQADFKKIVGKPEVMNLLTERIDLVVSLGEAYKNDPKGVKEKLDALSAQLNDQNQKDLAEYKEKLANNPKMQEEMKKSAQDFASGKGHDQQDQPTVENNNYGSNYNPNPYPNWYGYPNCY